MQSQFLTALLSLSIETSTVPFGKLLACCLLSLLYYFSPKFNSDLPRHKSILHLVYDHPSWTLDINSTPLYIFDHYSVYFPIILPVLHDINYQNFSPPCQNVLPLKPPAPYHLFQNPTLFLSSTAVSHQHFYLFTILMHGVWLPSVFYTQEVFLHLGYQMCAAIRTESSREKVVEVTTWYWSCHFLLSFEFSLKWLLLRHYTVETWKLLNKFLTNTSTPTPTLHIQDSPSLFWTYIWMYVMCDIAYQQKRPFKSSCPTNPPPASCIPSHLMLVLLTRSPLLHLYCH